ncbi:MAG: thiamine-phosphate kinase [Bacteroidota bacterium]
MSDEQNKRTDISELGEFGLIDRLTKDHVPQHKSTVKGVGDDAAVIDNGNFKTIITTDLLIEGIHFDLVYTPLKHLGYKAVVVNLSDVYAMNGTPKQITVSLGLSNRFSVEAIEEIYAGIYKACEFYGVDLIGGDTTSSNRGLIISVTAIGQAESDKIVYRHTAKEGDLICASGDFGAAYLGLQILEREKQIYMEHPGLQPELKGKDYLIGRLLKPEARADMIKQFAKAELIPTSMIDVSDGLASELFHICKNSNVGAYLEEGNISIHNETYQTAVEFKIDPTLCALSGGEDYELLFTVAPEDLDKVRFMHDIYIMGEIVSKADGIKLHTKGGNIHDLKAQGWVHFGNE